MDMKFLIASDIHGSAKYCKMLLDAFEKEKADIFIAPSGKNYEECKKIIQEENYDIKLLTGKFYITESIKELK